MIGNGLEKLKEDLKKAETEVDDALQHIEKTYAYADFIPGAPFAIPPQNIILLWDQWISQRSNKKASPVDDLKPVKIWDVNEANRITSSYQPPNSNKAKR